MKKISEIADAQVEYINQTLANHGIVGEQASLFLGMMIGMWAEKGIEIFGTSPEYKKLKISMKDPGALDNACDTFTDEMIGADDDEKDEKYNELRALAAKWLKHSEYLTLEIDLKTKTCRVLEQKE